MASCLLQEKCGACAFDKLDTDPLHPRHHKYIHPYLHPRHPLLHPERPNLTLARRRTLSAKGKRRSWDWLRALREFSLACRLFVCDLSFLGLDYVHTALHTHSPNSPSFSPFREGGRHRTLVGGGRGARWVSMRWARARVYCTRRVYRVCLMLVTLCMSEFLARLRLRRAKQW